MRMPLKSTTNTSKNRNSLRGSGIDFSYNHHFSTYRVTLQRDRRDNTPLSKCNSGSWREIPTLQDTATSVSLSRARADPTATTLPCSLCPRQLDSPVRRGRSLFPPVARLRGRVDMVRVFAACGFLLRVPALWAVTTATARSSARERRAIRDCDRTAEESHSSGAAIARPRTRPPRPPTPTVLLARTVRCAGFRRRMVRGAPRSSNYSQRFHAAAGRAVPGHVDVLHPARVRCSPCAGRVRVHTEGSACGRRFGVHCRADQSGQHHAHRSGD